MRVSCDEDDPGFAAWKEAFDQGIVFDVFSDGEPEPNAITADSDAGFVVRVKTDANGVGILDDALESFLLETVSGKVEFARKPKPADFLLEVD